MEIAFPCDYHRSTDMDLQQLNNNNKNK